MQQVRPHGRFPSDDSQALAELPFDPTELAARYGLAFEEGHDDLGWYRLAAITLPGGSQARLEKYRGEGDAGATVYVDAAVDPGNAKELLLRTFALTERTCGRCGPES